MVAINPETLDTPWPAFGLQAEGSSDTYLVTSLCCSDIEVLV